MCVTVFGMLTFAPSTGPNNCVGWNVAVNFQDDYRSTAKFSTISIGLRITQFDLNIHSIGLAVEDTSPVSLASL